MEANTAATVRRYVHKGVEEAMYKCAPHTTEHVCQRNMLQWQPMNATLIKGATCQPGAHSKGWTACHCMTVVIMRDVATMIEEG